MSDATPLAPAAPPDSWLDGPRPRVWPAVAVLLIQTVAVALTVVPAIDNGTRFAVMMLGPLACLLLFTVWLLAFSRLPVAERFAHLALIIAVGVADGLLADPSMGITLWIYGVPLSMLAVAVGVWVGRNWRAWPRLAAVAGLVAAAWTPFTLLRLDGFTGEYHPEFSCRWAASAEPPLAAPVDPGSLPAWEPRSAEWPGFRGANRDGRADGFTSSLDWTSARPKERWRVSVGAGWSSFAVVSGRLFTQEQRGESEVVSCYDADTGAVVWQFAHPTRFSDVVSGAGPRATPTFADGRLYAYGATAVLTCLDAATGQRVWQRDLTAEVKAQLPVWGFASSPLVVGDVVAVYADGDGDNGLVAFHRRTGEPVWKVASGGMNFSSAQRVDLAGRELILLADSTGLLALDPSNGTVLWRHTPNGWKGPPICQPQQVSATDLIVPLGDGVGLTRLEVTKSGDAWAVSEKWSSRKLKPSFNDFVVHDGHVYGFDQHIFGCLDAATGKEKWKEGRYGFGQVVLLAGAGRMVVTTEGGEVVLVAADPDDLTELGRVRAFREKTWNHPVAAGGRLYVRNGREAVCYDLSAPR